jgi:NTE family protein
VLEALKNTPVTVRGNTHTVLDEVDLITGVSGGSFTALAYALQGEKLFDTYEQQFLKRDVQGELIARSLNPLNWPKTLGNTYGRSELAADYYDEILFHGATFGDLTKLPTPMTVVSGTDISTGARFEFTQDNFDLICSDLSQVRLSRAAATSSAVPVVLSPVTYRNYGGTCHAKGPAWVADLTQEVVPLRPAGRALLRNQEIIALSDSKNRPYLHIVDGGVSDNLGLRGMLEAFEEMEASPNFQKQIGFASIRHIVVIAVNSRSSPSIDWDKSPTPPGLVSQLLQSSSVPIDHFSYESVELLKDIAERWANNRKLAVAQKQLAGESRAQAEAGTQEVSFATIDVSFDAIADPVEKKYFMELPTSFVLPDEAVTRLRALGGKLLLESKPFQDLMRQIREGNARSMAEQK